MDCKQQGTRTRGTAHSNRSAGGCAQEGGEKGDGGSGDDRQKAAGAARLGERGARGRLTPVAPPPRHLRARRQGTLPFPLASWTATARGAASCARAACTCAARCSSASDGAARGARPRGRRPHDFGAGPLSPVIPRRRRQAPGDWAARGASVHRATAQAVRACSDLCNKTECDRRLTQTGKRQRWARSPRGTRRRSGCHRRPSHVCAVASGPHPSTL